MRLIVIQQGVYRHGISRTFTSLEEAKKLADKLAREDEDSYHDYHVVSFKGDWCGVYDGEVVYKVSKDTVPMTYPDQLIAEGQEQELKK